MIEDLMETAEKYRSASNLLSYFEIGLLKLLSRMGEPISESVKVVPIVKKEIKKVENTQELEQKIEPLKQADPVNEPEEENVPSDVVEKVEQAEELKFESIDVDDCPKGIAGTNHSI